MKIRRYVTVFIFLIMVPMALAGCDQAPAENTGGGEAQSGSGSTVAFVYADNIEDYNWSYLHEIGRQYLAEQLPDVSTTYVEEVTAEDAEQTLRDLADEGAKLIFATSPIFSDAVLAVAPDYPETYFEVAQGTETADNVATYDGRMYQAFYLMGGYTGEMTESGIIGFIAPEPTPEVISHINALTLSSRLIRTCEDITVHVKWTNSWTDSEADSAAAQELVDEGADVLIQHTYSPAVQEVAEENGVRSVGYGFDMREFAPTANLTSVVWQWGWYYTRRVQDYLDGEWESEAYMGSVSTQNFGRGIIDLAPYTYDQIPQILEAPPMKWRVSYNETNKDAMDGPIYAQNGDLVLANREQFEDDYIFNGMDWFVQGVVGDAPGTPPEAVEGTGASIACS
ncbi:BMP family ABC transporter substrate-binding protein [Phototrophicus methaneseepsis]|uniref:BMP family ABC transporter substrate-binding protein n=1 Tax=Phototrophicus methaneseepsis TaxID=2710758 RepID=A0A7S8EDP1_9CHLR|nr:BMP family ABC transporter substrate-binding protein [Phototrophicus methaneseepsis]QPC84934.1 BMP family ABC transporter substrate-binding protein [Phototrophicus methaneseepsis]